MNQQSIPVDPVLLHQSIHGFLDGGLRTRLCNMMYRQRNTPLEPGCILDCPARICSIALTSNGRTAVTASEDNNIRIWDVQTGTCLHVLTGHTAPIVDIKISEATNCVLTISEDCTARIWDLATGVCLHMLSGHNGPLLGVALTPDGTAAITTSADNTARIWDIASGTCVSTINCNHPILQAQLAPDGSTAIIRAEKLVELYDTRTGQLKYTLPSEFKFYLSPDGKTIVTQWHEGYADSITICNLWDIATGGLVKCLMHNEVKYIYGSFPGYSQLYNVGFVQCVRFSPDGNTLLMVTKIDNVDTIIMLNLEAGTEDEIVSGKFYLRSVSFSPDGKHIAGYSYFNAAYLWDLRTGKTLTVNYADPALSIDDNMQMKEPTWRDKLHPFTSYPSMIALSTDANTVLTTSSDCTHIWNLPAGTLRYILSNIFSNIPSTQTRFNNPSNQSGFMASLWHYGTSWLRNQRDFNDVVMNPDGTTLAAVTHDGYNIKVWNIAKEEPEAALESLSVFQIALLSEVFQRTQSGGPRLIVRPGSDNHAAYQSLPLIIKRAIQPYVGIYRS